MSTREPILGFSELTGLHRVWDKVPTWQKNVIRVQAQTIKNLRTERAQMRRGYERKIRKLERLLAEARASIPTTLRVD